MKSRNRKNGLRAEYDFSSMSGGIRGKYFEAFRAGTNIAVLAEDVAVAFPTDDTVDRALRAIMEAAEALSRGKQKSKPRRRVRSGRG